MTLGAMLWNSSKPFYDQLTLAQHGDPAEQYATTTLGVGKLLPHYEQFWRYHVCPATTRPTGIIFRPGVADVVSVIAQRNYTVFMYLIEALEHWRLVDGGDLGPRHRNCYIALMYAGNALQVFAEFQTALCGKPGSLNGVADLATQLGVSIDPFPDWKQTWQYDRDLVSTYRNYLTHQGWFYTVYKSATKQLLVLKPDRFTPKVAYSWTHADRDYALNPDHWFPIQDLCRLVVNDTVAFLDLAYEKICKELKHLLTVPTYQTLWGWQPNQTIPTLPPALSAGSPPRVTSTIENPLGLSASTTGKTSSGIDSFLPGSGTVTT
jgi:hypothetical protein